MRKNFFLHLFKHHLSPHYFCQVEKKVRTIYIFKQQMCFFMLIGKWLFYDSSILFLHTVLLKWKNCVNNKKVVYILVLVLCPKIVRSAPPKLFEKFPTQLDFILLGKQWNYCTFFLFWIIVVCVLTLCSSLL